MTRFRKPLPPALAALIWLLAMFALVVAFGLQGARGAEPDYSQWIKWVPKQDERPFVLRLLRSISPVAQVASENAAAKLDAHHLDLNGADSSPGRLQWMPESWALVLTFQADF